MALIPLAIILILGACYSRTIAPDLTWAHFSADGGDLIAATASGGIPHPSGYPLYLILARGFQFIPVGNLAFRTNIFSAICTILTALFLYAFLVRQLRGLPLSQFVSFLAAIAYGLAPFVWGQALVTEVYALHGLLMMICIYGLGAEKLKINEWTRGLIFGVAASNHLTSIMMFPLLALGFEEKPFAPPRVFWKRCLGLLGGLSLYAVLPVRAYFHPPINWGDASTVDGFFWLVSGRLYYQYPFSLSFADVIQRFRACAGLLLEQYTWIGALLGIYGLFSRIPRRVFIPSVWMAGVFLFFAVFYGSYDSQVNLLPVWLSFAIWIAYGLQDIFMALRDRHKLRMSLAGLLFAALMLRVPFLIPSVNASGDFRARDFINHAVKEIPPDSLVFVDGDEQIFSLWYAQFALGRRQDMAIIAEGLLPYKWYHENLHYTYTYLNVPQRDKLQLSDLVAINPDRAICYISHDEPIVCVQDR